MGTCSEINHESKWREEKESVVGMLFNNLLQNFGVSLFSTINVMELFYVPFLGLN